MKKKILICLFFTAAFTIATLLSGCDTVKSLTNKVPEKYTDGVKYDRDFPDDSVDIYDNAVVYESLSLFNEIVLIMGTEDDMDDVIDFYLDFIDENGITLAEETDGKDGYYARFVFEGYEFKLQVEESDGEYVEDLFESVIYISSRELSGEELNAPPVQASPTAAPSAETTSSPTAAPAATAAPTPVPTANNSGETPLSYLTPGSWEMAGLVVDGEFVNAECTMYFAQDGSGAFYYYDYESDDRGFYYFSYQAGDGELIIYSDDGETSTFQAYFDDGTLHLINESGTSMYLANWSENYGITPSYYDFTAYGDWIYYEPETGYIETIAFWPGGSGYVKNFNGSGKNRFMYWAFENGIINISDDAGEEYSYGITHRGEVFELQDLDDGSVYFYNRVSEKYWLTGYFGMDQTNDDTVDEWNMSLYSDGTCEYTINGTTASSSWDINKATGKLGITLGTTYFEFDYHYDVEGLYLVHGDTESYYHFLQVG